jgi:hypothetical protein
MLEKALEVADKFKWVLLLLPGILAAACLGLVANVLKLTELQIFLLGCLFSIPLLLLVSTVLYSALLLLNIIAVAINYFTTLTFSPPRIKASTFWFAAWCLALFVAPVAGVNLAILFERDGLHRAASAIAFAGRLDADSIWPPLERLNYANTVGFHNLPPPSLDGRPLIPDLKQPSRTGDALFEIHLKTGEVAFVGWPRLYGPRGTESEIYLSPACQVQRGGTLSIVAGPGVVIKEREIAFVTLVDRQHRTSNMEHDCWKLMH